VRPEAIGGPLGRTTWRSSARAKAGGSWWRSSTAGSPRATLTWVRSSRGASFQPGPRGVEVRDGDGRTASGTARLRGRHPGAPPASRASLGADLLRPARAGADQAAAAIAWAMERGAHIVNLSLAVLPSSPGIPALVEAFQEAARSRVAIVVARPPEAFRRLARKPRAGPRRGPRTAAGRGGSRRGPSTGVPRSRRRHGSEMPPDLFLADHRRPAGFLASPFARPVPGLSDSANYRGPSLAAARLSGFAGKVLEAAGPLPVRELRRILLSWAKRNAREATEGAQAGDGGVRD